MENDAFCREVSAWLNTWAILEAGRLFDADKSQTSKPGMLLIKANKIKSGNDASLADIVTDYLKGFYIPAEILQILTLVYPLSSAAIEWLQNLRFEGKIEVDPIDVYHPTKNLYVMRIEERDIVIDILRPPITMLVVYIENVVSTWKPFIDQIDASSLFLRHSADGQLFVHLEAKVASSLGIPSPSAAGKLASPGTSILQYRSAEIGVSELPVDKIDIEAVKYAIRETAAETWMPI